MFRAETIRAKACLEDQTQHPVLGYRAASYSITRRSLWALDILAELGFAYDSSIFPIHHDRYGIPDSPRGPYGLTMSNGCSLIEFPPSTVSLWGYRLPVAGGGYFRLYPYPLTRSALAYINRWEGQPFIFYLHPWEIDPEQPRIRTSMLSAFRHYTNLNRCEERLHRLLRDFSFAPARDVLAGLAVPARSPLHPVKAQPADEIGPASDEQRHACQIGMDVPRAIHAQGVAAQAGGDVAASIEPRIDPALGIERCMHGVVEPSPARDIGGEGQPAFHPRAVALDGHSQCV